MPPAIKKHLTLTDIHADPRLLAEWLGVPFEGRTEVVRTPYHSWKAAETVEYTAEEVVEERWKRHRQESYDLWQKSQDNPHRPTLRTWRCFIAECRRELAKKPKRGRAVAVTAPAESVIPKIERLS